MASELLIRPGFSDHEVVADLLAPGGGGSLLPNRRAPIGRLLVDAQLARARPQLAEAAASAGIPCLVDPLTFLWQGRLRTEDRWALLPFGQPQPLRPGDLANVKLRERLVAEVVAFEVAQGASAVIPPYAYAAGPDDPWFEISLEMVRLTARRLHQEGHRLPIAPVLCGRLQAFAAPQRWGVGLDRFARVALNVGPQLIGLCLSPVGAKDSYAKLLRLFVAAQRMRSHGTPVIAWRQGLYGPGLVAAGLDGYETGMGTREMCDISSATSSRKPPKPGQKRGGGLPGVYVEPLGRSLSPRATEVLFEHRSLRARLMCDDQRCCPGGAASTLERRREHAVRTRARMLANLDALPHTTWRLHQVTKDARAAAVLAAQANEALAAAGVSERISPVGMESLGRVADHLRATELERRDAEAS